MMACGGDDKMITELPKPGGDDDGGKTEITPDKGITLYGLVSDKEGNPLEGVVVSDGYSVVASDKKGVYQIVRDPNAKHVFISVPSGYEIPAQANFGSYQGAYQAANSVTGSSSKPYRADFTLSKLAQSDKRFLLFGLGDPQPDNNDHIHRFRTETVPDVKKIAAKYSIPMVGIALGDILGKGDAQTFTSMKRAFGETGVPFFTTIGNHDKSPSNKRLVSEPISLIKLPNINIPIKGTAVGTNKATIVVTAIGKIIFNTRRFLISVFEGYSFSCSFMLIINSFLVQNSFTTIGMMTGTSAI